MLQTAVSIFAAIALLMPGFIIAALRALAYTLIVHLVFGFWTADLIEMMGSPNDWVDHVAAVSANVAVVLLGVPIAIGMGLNRYLAFVEAKDGPPNLFAAGLGGGEARDAFDYAYQRWRRNGVYVIVELVGHSPETPRLAEVFTASVRRWAKLPLRMTSTSSRFAF